MTPLRYVGGKSKVVKNKLSPLFPTEFNEFYEPFIGGGSVALWIAQIYPDKKIHINDLNPKLINFWKSLHSCPNELVAELHEVRNMYDTKDIEAGRELLKIEQEVLYDDTQFLFNQAVAYYVLNKISFSGLTEHGSISALAYEKTYNHMNIDRLTEIATHMENFKIYNQHFNEFMLLPKDDDFTFLDPPYQIESSNLYGKNGEMHSGFSHEEFAESLKKMKGKWMITYNDNEWLRETYKDFNIIDSEYRYSMSFSTDEEGNKNTRMKNELIITNY